MTKVLEYIVAKFPDQSSKIIDLFSRNEDFRILCEDYMTSMNEVEERRLNVIKNREVEQEFLKVYMELEKEIIHVLNAYEQKTWRI